jgi:hypothetical protein
MKKTFIFIFILLFSCKDFGSNPLGPDDEGENSISYTYSVDIQPIFSLNCTQCHHDNPNPSGGLNLTSYDDVMNSGSVVSGDLDASDLYDRITREESENGNMPPSGSLSSEEVELIEMWINQGAPTEW